MARTGQIALLISLFLTTIFAKHPTDIFKRAKQLQQRSRDGLSSPPHELVRRDDDKDKDKDKAHPPPTPNKFLTEKTKEFAVNGSGIPLVDFDVGTSYSGLIPISGDEDESRKLFFWFWPSVRDDVPKELVIWWVACWAGGTSAAPISTWVY
jgi:hypothetical protein